MSIYLGLDVHSKTTFVHAQDTAGATLYSGEITTSPEAFADLAMRLSIPADSKAALESCSMAGYVCGILAALEIEPVVISAREVRQLARRVGQKSDSRDAFELCDGLRRDIFKTRVWIPSPAVAELRRLMSARQAFVSDRTAAMLRLKALLRADGHRAQSAIRLASEKDWGKALAALGGSELVIGEAYQRQWKLAAEEVVRLNKMIEALLAGEFEKEVELLKEPFGVGTIVAGAFLAAVGDVRRFPTSAHLASYLGLVPSTYDSGGRERHGHITKQGASYARAMLCEAAQHASRQSSPLNPYYRKLAAQKGRKRAIVAVAHRLARILYQMLKKGERFDTRQLGVEYAPQTKTKTTLYQQKQTAKA